MKKYICFSTPMIQALQEGRKTQARRLMNPQPQYPGIKKIIFGLHPFAPSTLVASPAEGMEIASEREVWIAEDCLGNIVEVIGDCPYGKPNDLLWVKETVHMSQRESRLTIRLTDVKVERVQEINSDNYEEEGIEGKSFSSPANGLPYELYWNGDGLDYSTPREAFAALWESIYGPGPWKRNAWAWVLVFEVFKENIDEAVDRFWDRRGS